MSLVLRPLSLLLLRNGAPLPSNCNRTVTQAVRARPTMCRLRECGVKRLSQASSALLQQRQTGDSEAAGTSEGLKLSDSCVKVSAHWCLIERFSYNSMIVIASANVEGECRGTRGDVEGDGEWRRLLRLPIQDWLRHQNQLRWQVDLKCV